MPKGKVKEEERIEKIIRGLLKLPENKRCINCNSLGPQYVCTTFLTFVCTNCSGVHREFTHRVKSVSMAKFSVEEVDALQAGGNERARQIYLKEWDPHRNYFPDGSNLHRLRDFIKHVYIDRKYAGVRSNDKLSMVKASAKEDLQERHSFETSRHGAREEFFHTDDARRDDFFERHSFEHSFLSRNDGRNLKNHIDPRNSPRYKQEMLKSGSQNSRAPRFEIVDDRFRENGYGSVRKVLTHRYSDTESRARSSSPISQKSRDISKEPAIRPLKDILDDKIPPLKVGESPKANAVDGSGHVQTAGSYTIPGSVDKKEEENKKVNTLNSLIDFDANLEPSATTAVVQTQQTVPVGDGSKSAAMSSANEKASNAPNANSLELLLFGLADPAGSMPEMSPGGDNPAAIVGSSNPDVGTVSNNVAITTASHIENAAPCPGNSSDSKDKLADAQTLPALQQSEPFGAPPVNSNFTAQKATASHEAANNESLTSEPEHAKVPPTNTSFGQATQVVPQAANDTSLGNELLSGRKELPADLFTSSYSSFAAAVPGWQSTSPYGMGYGTQYHVTAMSMGAHQDSVKSRNPFDIGDDGPLPQGTMLPSMSPLQGPMPNMSTSQGLQPQVVPYSSATQPQRPPYGIMRPPGVYMGQQIANNILPSRPQGANTFGGNDAAFASLNPIKQSSGMNDDTAFSSLNPIQQSNGVNPSSAAPQSYSLTGGNPFG
nr:probable ADP-ribosylation factor GTPase-activating protein AGD14 isoform X1 [Coffea arabica]